jgi:phosphoglucosamine mutase
MTRRYFGTDGIRAKVGSACMRPQFMKNLGLAVNEVLGLAGKKVLIAHDGRESADMLIAALSSGLLASCDVDCAGLLPTPVLAYLAKDYAAGFMLSASHNPYYDNGIKIFASDGFKLADDVELKIEAACDNPSASFSNPGRVNKVDLTASYVDFITDNFSERLEFKIIVDCANGAWSDLAGKILQRCGCGVQLINNAPNGKNINQDCGALHPASLQAAVVSSGADIGFAFDGDGDRLIVCDNNGEIVDGDAVLYLLATLADKKPAGVVGTLMSNLSLEQALADKAIDFVRAKVGDRYVLSELRKRQWSLGGENSGHILNLELAKTGDALLTAITVLDRLAKKDLSLAVALQDYKPCPQVLLNIKAERVLLEDAGVNAAIRSAESELAANGRVLVRASGTEPLLRVMVEARDSELAREQAQKIVNSIENAG